MNDWLCVMKEDQSADHKETALYRTPSLLEICAHSYYFGGFLVGPQVCSPVTVVSEREGRAAELVPGV